MPAATRDKLFPDDAAPEICPACGQKIDKRSPDQISHHQVPDHSLFTGYGLKKRKRRWQASP